MGLESVKLLNVNASIQTAKSEKTEESKAVDNTLSTDLATKKTDKTKEKQVKALEARIETLKAELEFLKDKIINSAYTKADKVAVAELNHPKARTLRKVGAMALTGGMAVSAVSAFIANPVTMVSGAVVGGAVDLMVGLPAKIYLNRQAKKLSEDELKEFYTQVANDIYKEIENLNEQLNKLQ